MFVLVIKVRQTAGRGKIVGRGAEEERKTLEGKPQVNSVKRTCGRVEVPRKVDWNVPLQYPLKNKENSKTTQRLFYPIPPLRSINDLTLSLISDKSTSTLLKPNLTIRLSSSLI